MEINAYIGPVGKVGQSTGDGDYVHKGHPGIARGPAEVLVAIGVEFCRSVSHCLRGDLEPRHEKTWVRQIPRPVPLVTCSAEIALCPSPCETKRGSRGDGLGIMYRSISGGPGQGPGLVNSLVVTSCTPL